MIRLTEYNWPSREEWAIRQRTAYYDDAPSVSDAVAQYASPVEIEQVIADLKARWKECGREMTTAKKAAGSIGETTHRDGDRIHQTVSHDDGGRTGFVATARGFPTRAQAHQRGHPQAPGRRVVLAGTEGLIGVADALHDPRPHATPKANASLTSGLNGCQHSHRRRRMGATIRVAERDGES